MEITYSKTLSIDGKIKACESQIRKLQNEIIEAGEVARSKKAEELQPKIQKLQEESAKLTSDLEKIITIA